MLQLTSLWVFWGGCCDELVDYAQFNVRGLLNFDEVFYYRVLGIIRFEDLPLVKVVKSQGVMEHLKQIN